MISRIAQEAKPLISIIGKSAKKAISINGVTRPPKITIGTTVRNAEEAIFHVASKPPITIKGANQAQRVFEEGIGTNILAEQNRAMLERTGEETCKVSIKSVSEKNPSYAKYSRLLNEGIMTQQKAEELANEFYKNTGLILHCPSVGNEGSFDASLVQITEAVRQGTFPKDIKHVIIGHGVGNSLVPHSWEMSGPSWLDGKTIDIFEYISKTVKNKGEKVLVCSCEDANKGIAGKPGIGYRVDLSLTSTRSILGHNIVGPVKIVRAGENKICGHYTVKDGLVLYE